MCKEKDDKITFDSQDFPSPDAVQIANNLSNLGQIYNKEDLSSEEKVIINDTLDHINITLVT